MKSSLAPGKEEFGVVLVHQQDVPWRPSGKTVGFILIFPPSRKNDPLLCINKRKCLQWGLLHHLVDICFEHFSSTTLWLFNGTTCSSPPSRSGGRTISYCGRPRKQFAFPPITPRHIGAILRNFSTLACQNPFSSTFKLKVKLERKSADSLFCPSLWRFRRILKACWFKSRQLFFFPSV